MIQKENHSALDENTLSKISGGQWTRHQAYEINKYGVYLGKVADLIEAGMTYYHP